MHKKKMPVPFKRTTPYRYVYIQSRYPGRKIANVEQINH